TSCGRFADAVGTGECPEWQRELTVNQPSYDFAGSSPASPTSLRSLRELRLGRPAQLSPSEASEGCLVVARRAKTGLGKPIRELRLGRPARLSRSEVSEGCLAEAVRASPPRDRRPTTR